MFTSATAVLVAFGFLLAPSGTGIPASPTGVSASPVPRTVFIQTMDGEFGKMDADKNKSVTKAEIEQFQRAVAVAEARAVLAHRSHRDDPLGLAQLPEHGVCDPAG